MLSISLIRIRDSRCAQWDVNALTKRSLGRVSAGDVGCSNPGAALRMHRQYRR